MSEPHHSDSGLADLVDHKSPQIEALAADQRRRWMRGERVLLETYLGSEIARDDHESILDLICHEFLLLEEYGETPDRDAYLQRFPNLKAELEELIEVHRACGLAQSSDGTERANRDSTQPSAAAPAQSEYAETTPSDSLVDRSGFPSIPGYRIEEEIGRGGMGVVFRVWHDATQRYVALKIIRNGKLASPD
ncbi:MAG: hypothetical protein AAF497_06245 [Planctomycetota bacterium]